MSNIILDASAMLAAAFEESGADQVLRLLPDSVVGTVNVAEVQTKLVERGLTHDTAWFVTRSLSQEVIPFDLEQSRIAGSLVSATRHLGLSLGDRACLALAIIRNLPVCTADRSWAKLDIGVDIQLLR